MRRVALVLLAGCGRIGFDGAPEDGLVAYYPLDELTGNGTDDLIGRARAECTTCPVVGDGRIGRAMWFNGIDQSLLVSAPPLTTPGPFTVGVWLDWTGTPPVDYACPATKTVGTDAQNSWTICLRTDGTVFFGTSENNTVRMLNSNAMIGGGQWHHVAISWDGTTKTIRIDGSLDVTIVDADEFDSQPMSIGADHDYGIMQGFFAGAVDELRIYDRALDASEIAALAR